MAKVIDELMDMLRGELDEVKSELALVDDLLAVYAKHGRLDARTARASGIGGGGGRGRGRGRPRGPRQSASTSAPTRKRRERRSGTEQIERLLVFARQNPTADNAAIAQHLDLKLSSTTAMLSKVKRKGFIERKDGKLVVNEKAAAKLGGKAGKAKGTTKRGGRKTATTKGKGQKANAKGQKRSVEKTRKPAGQNVSGNGKAKAAKSEASNPASTAAAKSDGKPA